MYDYGLSTLEQYGLTAKSASRTRGALLCQTEQGLVILREFQGTEKKLARQQELLLSLEKQGFFVDSYLENQEGQLVSRDKDEIPFTAQHWFEGRECDTKSKEDLIKSIALLANLHKCMKLAPGAEDGVKSLKDEYMRHNQELRKIRKFIRKKGASGEFEMDFLSSVEWFLKRGELALERLEQIPDDEQETWFFHAGSVCHGEYNQHNVIFMKNGMAVTNFGHWEFDSPMFDLYCFMRKILEKYNWERELAEILLKTYHQIRPISQAEWKNLRIRFTYPEKYWKLANYYYSHNKAWISGKNVEKLKILQKQKEIWLDFVENCFEKYPFPQ